MAKKEYWTVVQHSAFGYAGNPGFEAGLETRLVSDGRYQNKIRTLGGKLFEDYVEAENYCMDEMYGPFDPGIIPHASGTFSDYEVDGLKLYIPKEGE